MQTWHSIVTHVNCHLDEIMAIWLLRRFGEEDFPGIEQATIDFWRPNGDQREPDPVALELEGTLLVGVGLGRFDEHRADGRLPGECATTLVAKHLFVMDAPGVQPLIKFVLLTDTEPKAQPFDLANLVKAMHRANPGNPQKVVQWAMDAIDAKYLEQMKFEEAAQQVEKEAVVETVTGPRGQRCTVVTISTSNNQAAKAARSKFQADVVIRHDPTKGHVQIFTSQRSGLKLYRVANILRLREQEARRQVFVADPQELSSKGMCAGWYYADGEMLLNGSETAPDVEPTVLGLEAIREAVRLGLEPKRP